MCSYTEEVPLTLASHLPLFSLQIEMLSCSHMSAYSIFQTEKSILTCVTTGISDGRPHGTASMCGVRAMAGVRLGAVFCRSPVISVESEVAGHKRGSGARAGEAVRCGGRAAGSNWCVNAACYLRVMLLRVAPVHAFIKSCVVPWSMHLVAQT